MRKTILGIDISCWWMYYGLIGLLQDQVQELLLMPQYMGMMQCCMWRLTSEQYHQSMFLELENVDEARILALNSILFQKKKAAKNYNKKVKHISFDEGDLVWKTILPIGIKSHKFGKWSPNQEGPYQIHSVFPGGAYTI